MPRLRCLALSDDQRRELLDLRDHAPEPYLRERAAALLMIAVGLPAAVVARQGLLRPRKPDTVYAWLDRYQAEGSAGLRVRPGRGRKPAFSPSVPGYRPRRSAAPVPARSQTLWPGPNPLELGGASGGLPGAGRPDAGRGASGA